LFGICCFIFRFSGNDVVLRKGSVEERILKNDLVSFVDKRNRDVEEIFVEDCEGGENYVSYIFNFELSV
jgi:hypothetical protein